MMQSGNPNLDGILQALLGIAQAENKTAKAIAQVFPQGLQVTTTAGAATGKYLTITAPDGNTYKIALLAVS